MMFLPLDAETQAICRRDRREDPGRRGVVLLGWREVPTDETALGDSARAGRARQCEQCFVTARERGSTADAFERELYVVTAAVRIARSDGGGPRARGVGLYSSRSLSATRHRLQRATHAGQPGALRIYRDLSDALFGEPRWPSCISPLRREHLPLLGALFRSPSASSAHNGEINTLRGNRNQMLLARAAGLGSRPSSGRGCEQAQAR